MKIERKETYILTLSKKEITTIVKALEFTSLEWGDSDSDLFMTCIHDMLDQFVTEMTI